MNTKEEYCLLQYQDLGILDTKEKIRLKRHKIYGTICVEKRLSAGLKSIYDYLKEHPSDYIPRIYECIVSEDVLIVIEDYIEGRTLEDMILERRMDEKEAVWVLKELCTILKILHSAEPPIICRDIKAENVMISKEHQIKLIDFDIARTFQEGKKRDTVLMGTAEYAAPEQFGFFQTDNRTDIYSLGILMNYIMTGKFPVEETIQGKMKQIVKKSTRLDPKERYQTVDELLKHVFALYPEETIQEKADSWMIPGFRSRNLWKMIVAVFGYSAITRLCFSMEITSKNVVLTQGMVRIEQTIIWISQVIFIGVVCNYRNMNEEIILLNNDRRIVRICGYIIAEFVLIFMALLLCSLLDTLLF